MSDEYDFIVIGAGNAGAVLASRLSANPNNTVLVLEAGKDHHGNGSVCIPQGAMSLWPDKHINWAFETAPQAAYENRCIAHPRGKGLGGSTLVNLGMMNFPDRHSVDSWRDLGNPGWSYKDFQPHIRKFHTFHEPSSGEAASLSLDYSDPSVHGTNGPVHVSYGSFRAPFQKAWVDAFNFIGWKAKADALSGDLTGGHTTPGAINPATASRSYAGEAYLPKEVLARPNLKIITCALVEKIVLRRGNTDEYGPEGVIYKTEDGTQHSAGSKLETLLCAGVFKSPHILELSGIGAPNILARHNVQQLIDLPGVGENLQDHAAIGISVEANSSTFDSFREPTVLAAAFNEYAKGKGGPLANAVYCAAFMPCMDLLGEQKQEFLETLAGHLNGPSCHKGLQKQHEIVRATVEDERLSSVQYFLAPVQLSPEQTSAEVTAETRRSDFYSLYVSLTHPFSRGSVHMATSSAHDYPTVDPRYFSHSADTEVAARHIRWLQNLLKLPPLSALLKPNGKTIPSELKLDNLDYCRELVKTGFTTYHPCGSCSMMPREDGGVVNPDLKVYGTRGLRVVDASIFPLIPRGNIQSYVYALAEKAADMIRREHGV